MKKEKKKKLLAILKLIILLGILIGIPVYLFTARRDVIASFRSFQDVREYILGFGKEAALGYIAFQIAQIIISFLPGEFFQIAAGFIFGFLPGLILSVIGAFIGSSITYWLARFLGQDALFLLFGEEKAKKWMAYFQKRSAYTFTLVVYLIPGTPKDILCYLAGISNMKFVPYILISNAARVPAMCISLLFGKFLLEKNYTFMIVIAVCVLIVLLLFLIFRKKIDVLMDRFLSHFA
ncbi:MAG: VTT domain-containing protein [Eubacteriales bacterium]|nr:VTT domain-containing protein [Eubacteriales bacterium]